MGPYAPTLSEPSVSGRRLVFCIVIEPERIDKTRQNAYTICRDKSRNGDVKPISRAQGKREKPKKRRRIGVAVSCI